MAKHPDVAPHAGAWIETHNNPAHIIYEAGSPPMRGRGLKLYKRELYFMRFHVAPHAGAWIETVLASC